MGGGGSSSKRKSFKGKSSKVSSEARRKKRNSRKRSKRHHRRDDSVSSSSDGEAVGSSSFWTSSSEDDYRSSRARSKKQDNIKNGKKRIVRSPSSPEGSRDSGHARKRKMLKKKGNSEARKKVQKKKKKPRRDLSPSSDSRSCSTCRGGYSSSSEEEEFERRGGGSKEKETGTRDSTRGGIQIQKRKHRSRGCSSCNRPSSSGTSKTIENLAVKNFSKPLRSVITCENKSKERERNEENKDRLNEEIVQDCGDYPSKSNDTNDFANRRDLPHLSYPVSEKKTEEILIEEEAFASDTKHKVSGKEELAERCRPNFTPDGASSAKTEVNQSDDLELILRQKALENLKRFREVRSSNTTSDSDAEQQLTKALANFVEGKPANADVPSMINQPQAVVQRSRFTWRRDSSLPVRIEGKKNFVGSGDEGSKNVVHFQGNRDANERPNPVVESESNKNADEKPQSTSCETNSNNVVHFQESKNASKTPNPVAEGESHKKDVEKPQSTAPETTDVFSSEEGKSREGRNDATQFEQKTMFVTRGGKMVQVSYKVYIPKRAPALARRQLKR